MKKNSNVYITLNNIKENKNYLTNAKLVKFENIDIFFGHFLFLEKLYKDIHKLLKKFIVHNEERFINFVNFISIEFILPFEMAKLNQEYRQKLWTTDVLAIAYTNNIVSGIIYVDPLFIMSCLLNDIEMENNFTEPNLSNRILEAINHGILHILGYDHQKNEEKDIMFIAEKANLSNLDLIIYK